jgi:hypothetical protein
VVLADLDIWGKLLLSIGKELSVWTEQFARPVSGKVQIWLFEGNGARGRPRLGRPRNFLYQNSFYGFYLPKARDFFAAETRGVLPKAGLMPQISHPAIDSPPVYTPRLSATLLIRGCFMTVEMHGLMESFRAEDSVAGFLYLLCLLALVCALLTVF